MHAKTFNVDEMFGKRVLSIIFTVSAVVLGVSVSTSFHLRWYRLQTEQILRIFVAECLDIFQPRLGLVKYVLWNSSKAGGCGVLHAGKSGLQFS